MAANGQKQRDKCPTLTYPKCFSPAAWNQQRKQIISKIQTSVCTQQYQPAYMLSLYGKNADNQSSTLQGFVPPVFYQLVF